MKKKNSKLNKVTEDKNKLVLTPGKKKLFFGLMFSLPFLLFILLEICLRIFQYGGDLSLFIEGPPGYENYLRCNPDVARRYFDVQTKVPTPPKQLFRKQKTKNGYRMFVLGESSAAGFPYVNNASFPNILERALSNTFPNKEIEVINVAMAAINSYTLLDFMDEILNQSPDAILIYTGHNEYYGALGVGSSQSLGNSRWLIQTYLKLESFKTFLMLRDFFGWTKIQISKLFYKGSQINPSATLMERIVGEQTIPFNSELYKKGKEQFSENLEEIIIKAKSKGIKVVLSELVSNVKDQAPFISETGSNQVSAKYYFETAQKLEEKGKYEEARSNYLKAKDLDELRFRAPEEFNIISSRLSEKYSLLFVRTVSYFENESPNRLIGNNLMLEHLHPNTKGYFLLAKAFYETMKKNKMIADDWEVNGIENEIGEGITELDSVYASLAVLQLKSGWPFQPKSLPNVFLSAFVPANHIEEAAFNILKSGNSSLEAEHMNLGRYYEKQNQLDKAFLEYNALITAIPSEMEFYEKAATVLIRNKKYDQASRILTKSLKYKETSFAYKWIGQIALMKDEYQTAINYLLKADVMDAQIVFNLARAYYLNSQPDEAEKYFQRLKRIAPESAYFANLSRMRTVYQLKKSSSGMN